MLVVGNASTKSRSWAPGAGHQLPLTLANWMTGLWPIAVIRAGDLNDCNAAKAAGQRPFVCVGNRPIAVIRAMKLHAFKQTLRRQRCW
jgi:hypothetical protein